MTVPGLAPAADCVGLPSEAPGSQMRAAYVTTTGPAESVRVGPLPVPRPGPAEVLVDVELSVVNNVDTFVRSGAYRTELPLPFVLGRDLVGTVAEVGDRVTRFVPGDRVWSNSLGHGGRQGAAAERAAVAEERAYPVPPGACPQALLAVAHPAATAHLALGHGRVGPGDAVVVTGAGGNVGGAAVVLAARAGARVVATASAADTAYCRGLGAEHVVDHRDREAVAAIADVVPGGVDAWIDAAGENDLTAAVDLLAPRGRLVVLAGADTRPELPVGPLYMKDVSIHGFAISNAGVDELAGAAEVIGALVTAGRLHPRAVETFPLEATGELHRRVEQQGQHGTRLLLRPSQRY